MVDWVDIFLYEYEFIAFSPIGLLVFMTLLLVAIQIKSKKKLRPTPRPNRIPYNSETFRQ